MIGDRTEHFQGKGKQPAEVQAHLEEYLKKDGFTVQTSAPSDQGIVIQAKKGGFLSEVIDADRALTITVSGSEEDLVIRVGIGRWLQHLAVAAIETFLISDLFLIVDVPETAWNFEIEDKLLKDLREYLG